MTTERWTDERLDKLAETVVQTAESLGRTADTVGRAADTVGRAADTVNQLITGMNQLNQRTETIALAVERMTDVQLQTFRVIEEMQAEVRGLQTENRRILDHLFGET